MTILTPGLYGRAFSCREEGDAHVYTGEVTYDEHSNLASFEEQVGTARTPYTTTFSYDEENRPTLLKYGSDTDKVTYTYDGLGRIEKRTLTVGGTARETSYAFIAGGHGDGSTTGLVASISQTGGNFTYTYDDNGNITSVVQDGVTTSYTYDALGQLIRVVDGHEGATWEYSYDQGGNILSKKKYVNGVETESMDFEYTNENWRDQLTKVNGTTITYDQIGNPLSDGTWTYTWEKGRQLKSMSKSGTTASFKYNENGLRIQKTVNGVVTDYTIHGKNIVHMTQGSNNLHFFYDASNKPAIVEYNGTKYAYVHNLQGDIVAILDSDGTAVVQYKYDAWGKQIGKTGSMASTLGTVQPFRYRGYVYDEETGLYYLRSRYYNAHNCRFINADALINGNLYAYCENSPIVHKDSNGYALCCCFDDNGFETTLMSHFMYGGSCGGGGGSLMGSAIIGNHSTELQDEIELAAKEAVDTMVQCSVAVAMPLITTIAVALHYNRNSINVSYTEYELVEVMGYIPEGTSSDKFHQNNQIGGRNRKYVVNPGWFSGELVFYSDGSLNDTPEDRGTVNVYSGDNPVLNVVVHGLFDVVPYMIYGNSPDDATTIIDRIHMIFK